MRVFCDLGGFSTKASHPTEAPLGACGLAGLGSDLSSDTVTKQDLTDPPAAAAGFGSVAGLSRSFRRGLSGGASNSDLTHTCDLGGRRFLGFNGGAPLPYEHGARPGPASASTAGIASEESHQWRRELLRPTRTGNGFCG